MAHIATILKLLGACSTIWTAFKGTRKVFEVIKQRLLPRPELGIIAYYREQASRS